MSSTSTSSWWVLKAVLAAATAAGIGACAVSAISQVGSEFPCAQLSEEWVGESLKKVTGCGIERVYGFQNGKWQSPAERASYEMKCEDGELRMRHLGGNTVGVTGCGKTVVYVADVICARGMCSFHGWVLNSARQ